MDDVILEKLKFQKVLLPLIKDYAQHHVDILHIFGEKSSVSELGRALSHIFSDINMTQSPFYESAEINDCVENFIWTKILKSFLKTQIYYY